MAIFTYKNKIFYYIYRFYPFFIFFLYQLLLKKTLYDNKYLFCFFIKIYQKDFSILKISRFFTI